ncbi:hypothetical protein J8164_000990 [Campylobacter lari]|nr:hypothetical protein [Campylobacter lari]EHH9692511.1 hypothetical protein [Campylobacter lari]
MDKIYFTIRQELTGVILDFQSFAVDRMVFSLGKDVYLDRIKLLYLTIHEKWEEIHDYNLLTNFNNKIIVDFKRTVFNYLKIEFSDQVSFELEIDLFLKNKLIVAGLNSYIGDRFLSILNSMYIADILKFNFAMVWNSRKVDTKDIKKHQSDKKLVSYIIDDEKEIFDDNFLQKNSYTSILPIRQTKWMGKMSFHDLKYGPFVEKQWGWYIGHSPLEHFIEDEIDKSYGIKLQECFKKIIFSKKVQEVITKIDLIAKKFIEKKGKFNAIHVRTGDIVYCDENPFFAAVHWRKAMPPEIALELALKNLENDINIVLFGDSLSVVEEIQTHCNTYYQGKARIYKAQEFIGNLSYLTPFLQAFAEIIFMSNANEIYSGDSSFARLASIIGHGKEPKYYFKFYSFTQQENILIENIGILKTDNTMKAYVMCYYYLISRLYLNKNFNHLVKIVFKILSYNPNNEFYHVLFIDSLLNLQKYDSAEKHLNNYIFKLQREDKFLSCLKKTSFYNLFKNAYLSKNIDEKYKKLTLIKNLII